MIQPSIQQLSQTIISQLEASFSQTIPLLPKSFTRILGKVIAGAQILSCKYTGWSILQAFVTTASFDECTVFDASTGKNKTIRPLVEWGGLLGVDPPSPAIPAEVVISVTVTNQVGTLAALRKLRSATGVIYDVAFEVKLTAPTVQATVRAIADGIGGDGSGTVGNITTGEKLTFLDTPANVSSTATVVYQTITGADGETADAYRARVLGRSRTKPKGGALLHYKQWGEEVSGIANVYPYSGQPGEMDLYVETTVESLGNVDGIPTSDQLEQVKNSILFERPSDIGSRLATKSPANDLINTLPIRRSAFDVQIFGVVPAGHRGAISDQLDEYFRSRRPYIPGVVPLPREDLVTNPGASAVVEGVVQSFGDTITSILLFEHGGIGGPPLDGRYLYLGELAKVGDVVYAGDA